MFFPTSKIQGRALKVAWKPLTALLIVGLIYMGQEKEVSVGAYVAFGCLIFVQGVASLAFVNSMFAETGGRAIPWRMIGRVLWWILSACVTSVILTTLALVVQLQGIHPHDVTDTLGNALIAIGVVAFVGALSVLVWRLKPK